MWRNSWLVGLVWLVGVVLCVGVVVCGVVWLVGWLSLQVVLPVLRLLWLLSCY